MSSSLLLRLLGVVLVAALAVRAEFSEDFRQFLIRRYGRTKMAELERLDMGGMRMGSFGGRESPNERRANRPVVMIHGTTLRAGIFNQHRDFFMQNGYQPGELFATTYSDGGLSPLFAKKMECRDVQQVRDMIKAVAEYSNSTVDVLGYSMGVAMTRKAILGGRCVDTLEELGEPLTHLVDTYVGVGGVAWGYESCVVNERTWPACNPINGMVWRSKFLLDVNAPPQKYEGKTVYAIYTTTDQVVGQQCNGKQCSSIKNADLVIAKSGFDHVSVLFLTKELQFSLFKYHISGGL
ncbi:Lipase EstA/Esterase EstB family-containing protein [Aphelenchoides fujianensis]|nr:Lipase EstA/Esterase EstB family-containing protein [Aphelenchoides fujianensis]